MGKIFTPLIDFILPPLCAGCRRPSTQSHMLCAQCWQTLSFIDKPFCMQCGLPFEFSSGDEMLCAHCVQGSYPFTLARAALRYDDASRRLISLFKYHDQIHLLPLFEPWLVRVAKPLIEDVSLVVPVPMHRWRLWRRTYNQAALLAQTIGKAYHKPVALFALRRARHTRPQVGLDAQKRRKNLHSAFACAPEQVKNQCILLIDDVYTTGATLETCAHCLLQNGAREVRVLTLARVINAKDVSS